MSNPFKVGDKLVCIYGGTPEDSAHRSGELVTVRKISKHFVVCEERYQDGTLPESGNDHANYRAAIAGQDYDVPAQPNTGHLPDGSSVQKHSAGPIYPCVITLRDKRLKGTGLFDYGITSPRNPEPVWLSTLEAAHTVADIINKDIAQ